MLPRELLSPAISLTIRIGIDDRCIFPRVFVAQGHFSLLWFSPFQEGGAWSSFLEVEELFRFYGRLPDPLALGRDLSVARFGAF